MASSSSSAPALDAFFQRVNAASSAALEAASSGVGFGIGEAGYAASQQLARCFAVTPEEAGLLVQGIAMMTAEQIGQACKTKLKQLPGVGLIATRFRDFVSEYLAFLKRTSSTPGAPRSITATIANLKQYNQQQQRSMGKPSDAEGWIKTYDAFALVITKGANVFNENAPWFNETLRFLTTSLLELAFQVDAYTCDGKKEKSRDAAGRLSKLAGQAGNDRSPGPCGQTRRIATLWLANASFKAYLNLNNVRLCATVLNSVDQAFLQNAKSAMAAVRDRAAQEGTIGRLGEMEYSRGDRVTYHYFVGRILLSGHNIKEAYKELRWAFDNCSVGNIRNLRRIMIPLTTCALILGIHPAPEVLQELGLWPVFGKVVTALQKGHGAAMMQALEESRRLLRKWGVFLLLRDKLQVSCWRCLVRRSLLVYRASRGLEGARPTLELSELHKMAKLAWQDEAMTVMDVESIVTSLIGQGYIKAYIQHEKGIIVFDKQDMGMVPMGKMYSSLA